MSFSLPGIFICLNTSEQHIWSGPVVFAFDSLGYAKKLRDAGVSSDQAEAHAEAARDFVMAELVTRNDLDVVRRELQASIDTTRRDLETKIDHLGLRLETQTLRLTVRMGIMFAAGLTLLAAVLRLHP